MTKPGRRHRGGPRPRGLAINARERDLETIRLVNDAVDDGKDLRRLRQLSAVRGLVNSDLRARLWPTLSGADVGAVDAEAYARAASGAHRDATTVDCDVARSLWSLLPADATDAEREDKRAALRRLLNAVVVDAAPPSPGDEAEDGAAGGGIATRATQVAQQRFAAVHYYQGLHDVASVLLLVAGERAAFAILRRLAAGPLRDATRPTLDPVLELLGFMAPLLEAADPELADLAASVGLPPYYALSWFITWFAHDVRGLGAAARLFDLFLATHPLMPLYVGAAAMRGQRRALLAAGRGDGGMPALHSALTNLDVLSGTSADRLACEALELYRRLRPEAVLAARRLRAEMAVAPRAFKDRRTGMWRVPEPSKRAVLAAAAAAAGGGGRNRAAAAASKPPVPQWRQLQQAIAKLLALPGVRVTGGGAGAGGAGPVAVLLSLGVYTAVAAATWAMMRLQLDGGGGARLPWG